MLAPEFARRQRLHQYQHLGTIALARHPWAPEKVVVLIHGTSLEATYAGIHAFTESFDECARRPLGGVYYVQASGDRPPYMWTSGVKARWLTPPYTVAEYRERLAVSPLPHAHEVEALLELLAARAKANTHPSDEDPSGATEATEG